MNLIFLNLKKTTARILKVTQLIKKTLSEVFLTIDFTYDNGEKYYIVYK